MLYNFVHERDGDELNIHYQQGDNDNNNIYLLQLGSYLVADAVQFSTMAFLFSHMYAPCPLIVG